MNWETQTGFCPQCGDVIAPRDFVNGSHQCKKGFIQCGICSVPVVIGNKIKLMFCPNVECVNSEENY
jgi:hypothetical protein